MNEQIASVAEVQSSVTLKNVAARLQNLVAEFKVN